jgi:4-amino-4-deoxy-L-arabinose transferase-like glycosyltransferase
MGVTMTGSTRALDARWFGLWSIVAMVAVAIVTRAAVFGNAAYSGDDQYYLLVGKAIDHGQLPYVDIWDRKPIGLFLIYAAIARLGGSGVEQYQLVAGLFAVATAWVVTRLASRIANRQGALLAGIVYLATLVPFGGQGGQSPVFYNLLIASAALAMSRL